jgi:hypothetical protein
MSLDMYVLRRPYTVIAGLVLLCILGVGARCACQSTWGPGSLSLWWQPRVIIALHLGFEAGLTVSARFIATPNFGLPAPVDIRISGPDSDADYALAQKITGDISRIPGVVDSHVFKFPMHRRLRSMSTVHAHGSSALARTRPSGTCL